jgi:hypothetical protein
VPLKYPVDRTSTDSTFLRDFPYGALGAGSHFCSDSDTVGQTSSASRASCPRFILHTSFLLEAGEATSQVMRRSWLPGMTLVILVRCRALTHA